MQGQPHNLFLGISTADDTWTKEELEQIGLNVKREARRQYAERQEEKFSRMAEYSLDTENQETYKKKAEEWKRIQIQEDSTEKYRAVDVTEEWFRDAQPDSHEVTDLFEYIVDGITYKVDGKYVRLDYSDREKSGTASGAQAWRRTIYGSPDFKSARYFYTRLSFSEERYLI